eukprot:gene11447-biopygen13933
MHHTQLGAFRPARHVFHRGRWSPAPGAGALRGVGGQAARRGMAGGGGIRFRTFVQKDSQVAPISQRLAPRSGPHAVRVPGAQMIRMRSGNSPAFQRLSQPTIYVTPLLQEQGRAPYTWCMVRKSYSFARHANCIFVEIHSLGGRGASPLRGAVKVPIAVPGMHFTVVGECLPFTLPCHMQCR